MRLRRALKEDDIEKVLFSIPFESDDDLQLSDDDPDFDIQKLISQREFDTDSEFSVEEPDQFSQCVQHIESDSAARDPRDEIPTQEQPSSDKPYQVLTAPEKGPDLSPSTSAGVATQVPIKRSEKRTHILWKNKALSLNPEQKAFHGSSTLPGYILSLDTPFQFFKYFFTDEILNKIVDETLLYSAQKDPSKVCNVNAQDINKYIGICLFSPLVTVPNVRDYWSNTLGISKVSEVMAVYTFETIRRYLHFNDNSTMLPIYDVSHDRLHKIRPFIDKLRERFLSVPMEERLSVDEQICTTKARHHLKQYVPIKPHKWGYKNFILSGVSGFAYDFEVYTGSENKPENRDDGEPDFGAASNVVVRLSRHIPSNLNHKLYFDNYFTSVPLAVYLHKKGIQVVGTVRRNRIPDSKLPSEEELRKEERGKFRELVADIEGVDVSCVIWKDNKYVVLLSTYAGSLPTHEVERYDRKVKKKVAVQCPDVVREYNMHMGGVDILDSIMARHRITFRSKIC